MSEVPLYLQAAEGSVVCVVVVVLTHTHIYIYIYIYTHIYVYTYIYLQAAEGGVVSVVGLFVLGRRNRHGLRFHLSSVSSLDIYTWFRCRDQTVVLS